ncbi:MAG TPA: GatB/YqeY domain-containing protein [Pseudobdellovibrionaceae bacterium]|nr:GatB/YqeY domain-containing protein [Pseudobdellovibrionaceae bacterium]
MEIREKISADVKAAMLAKDSVKLGALRFLQSAIKYREIELRPNPISSDEVLGVMKKLVKQRKESIDQYQAAQRQDLVDKEVQELKIIEAYLPAQLSKEDLEKVVLEVISSTGASSIKDMGNVMKAVLAKTGGAADNKLVSEIVKQKLG